MKNSHEYEFLPAALEIQETPPSPIGRLIIWSLLLLAVIAWAIIGQVDIIATAQGKIIPGGRDKVIQPLEVGIVRKIHEREGQHVEKGDLLVELDTTANESALENDIRKRQAELNVTRNILAKLQATLPLENGVRPCAIPRIHKKRIPRRYLMKTKQSVQPSHNRPVQYGWNSGNVASNRAFLPVNLFQNYGLTW